MKKKKKKVLVTNQLLANGVRPPLRKGVPQKMAKLYLVVRLKFWWSRECSVSWVLWHINHCRLFNAKYSLYIYIYIYLKCIWFGWVKFYGISTIVGYLMSNPVYTYILDMILLGWVLWHINYCRLFNAKSSPSLCIKCIWFGWVEFYGISTVVGYLIPNPVYTYMDIKYIWFG